MDSPCPHYGICGGCEFQTLPYEEQLKMNRDANDITVHLDMITKPSKLTRKAKYTMAFMGSLPTKNHKDFEEVLKNIGNAIIKH